MAKSPQMEDFEERGVMNEVDQDYLDHLDVPELSQIDQVTLEGVIGAIVHDKVSKISDTYREIKGWLLGVESKRKYIEEICNDLIEWLKDKDINYRNLDLDAGTFGTWMKTSEFFYYRFFFLLNEKTWHQVLGDLKSGNVTHLESIYSMQSVIPHGTYRFNTVNFTDRTDVMRYLDSVGDIKTLVKIVETYKQRVNEFCHLIIDRRIKIKGAPFQVMLLGAADLRRTCKKIVNLAI